MDLYALIYEENSDSKCGADVALFFSSAEAATQMKEKYEKSLELLRFDKSRQEDDYHCECSAVGASIVMGMDTFTWRVENLAVEGKQTVFTGADVAIEVSGGLVQNVYANGPVSVEVYDLDTSDFADKQELTEAEVRERELKELIASPNWKRVW